MNPSFQKQLFFLLNKLDSPALKKNRQMKLEVFWIIGKLLDTQMLNSKKDRILSLKKIKQISQQYNGKNNFFQQLSTFHHFYCSYLQWEQVFPELSWTHYRQLIKIKDKQTRNFYTFEAKTNQWNTKELKRQIETQSFKRNLQNQKENNNKNTNSIELEAIIKETYILEFLKLDTKQKYLERDLENALLNKLQDFIAELGNGFSFVAQQKRISTSSGKRFFVDLVFYHFLLKRFILFELKITELSHRDIGQMDMYVRYYDKHWRKKDDNPTIGIILCSNKDQTLLKYSMIEESPQLFAAQYRLCLPSGEDITPAFLTKLRINITKQSQMSKSQKQ